MLERWFQLISNSLLSNPSSTYNLSHSTGQLNNASYTVDQWRHIPAEIFDEVANYNSVVTFPPIPIASQSVNNSTLLSDTLA